MIEFTTEELRKGSMETNSFGLQVLKLRDLGEGDFLHDNILYQCRQRVKGMYVL